MSLLEQQTNWKTNEFCRRSVRRKTQELAVIWKRNRKTPKAHWPYRENFFRENVFIPPLHVDCEFQDYISKSMISNSGHIYWAVLACYKATVKVFRVSIVNMLYLCNLNKVKGHNWLSSEYLKMSFLDFGCYKMLYKFWAQSVIKIELYIF